ncbi:CotH kinase family protein [Tissierella sp. MSJ-40]|uniref:CotH kinase family protein n=1 Tax=Tissierella simiarum TaxID=2841534 RepID=A0ABS6E4T2_9FIRM|nr:CotH kinase family protein [Tissierella simiarum]MBU5437925.1 CotH kinase family protein [Tissierella simiarum]
MIKEKSVTSISLISITVVALLLISYIMSTSTDKGNQSTIQQPEYVDKIFNKDIVSEIDIIIDENSWKDLLENAIKEEYYNCDIIINGETFSNVGIRAKGNSSLTMVANDSTTDRYSFKVNFGKYIKGQSYYGLDKLVLNNNISDATSMKEYLSYEMFEEMGVPTPGFSYTSIKVNGEVWGLYLAVEVMEESFIERYFGRVDGNLYKPEGMEMGAKAMGIGGNKDNMPKNFKGADEGENRNNMPENFKDPGEGEDRNENPEAFKGPDGRGNKEANLVYNGDDISNYSSIFDNSIFKTTDKKDYKTVIEMMKNLSEGTNLEEYLDTDEILRYFAVNTFLVNLDSYAGNMKHNYYLYERNGEFQILPWDFNLSFAGHEIRDASSAINFPIDKPVSDSMENSPLISKLLEKEEYKEIYHQYLEELVVNYIKSGKYEASISKVNELIKKYIKEDPTAFFTYEQYESSLPVLLKFGKDRSESIIAQLNGQQPSTTYGNISTSIDLSALGSMGRGAGDRAQGNRQPNMENMPNPELMGQIMEIIGNTDADGITEEQKSKLKDLGLTDSQMEEMIQMKNQMPLKGNEQFQEQEEFRPRNNQQNKDFENNRLLQDNTNNQWIILIVVSVLTLLIALLFVSKFERRKYYKS